MIGGNFRTSYRQEMRLVQTRAMLIWVVLLAAALCYLPFVLWNRSAFGIELSNHQLLNMGLSQVNSSLIAIIGAVGLNLLTGYTGLISLGNAGFFALGGIVAAAVGVQAGGPFLLAVIAAGAAGAIVGALVGLPSLRVRGFYLLLATMALHFIMVYLFLRYSLEEFGPAGVIFAPPSVLGWDLNTDIRWYFFLLAVCAVCLLLTKNILRTREGRAFVAVRDNDIAAGSVGINVSIAKVRAFATSSFMIAAAGAIYVWYLGNATADLFSLALAIQFIAMIIIGGMGSLLGAVLGAIVWQLLPQVILTFTEMSADISPGVNSAVTDWRSQITNIAFGAIIFAVLVFEPGGLAGLWGKAKRMFVRWPYTT